VEHIEARPRATVPLVAGMKPDNTRIVVLLPAARFGPSKPTISPRRRDRERNVVHRRASRVALRQIGKLQSFASWGLQNLAASVAGKNPAAANKNFGDHAV